MLRSLKLQIAKLAHACGYTIIPNWQRDRAPLAWSLREIFRKYEIDCVFDVGANEGQYRDFLRRDVRFMGPIISFEPLPDLAKRLSQRASHDSHWLIREVALTETRQDSGDFYRMSADVFSSFRRPISEDNHFAADNSVVEPLLVDTSTLDEEYDSFAELLGFSTAFLKLDTQGWDLEAAKGGARSLGAFRGLQTEINLQPLYVGGPGFHESLHFFQERGFDPVQFCPVTRDQGLRAIEVDCVMVNGRGL